MSDSNTTGTPRRHSTRSRGELVFDVALVLAIGAYLLVARSYPAIGRQIPTVVGLIALAAAVLQLIGWFVPGLWRLTHGDPSDDTLAQRAPRAASEITRQRPAQETTTTAGGAQPGPGGDRKPLDVPIAMAWAGGFLGAILLFGYVVAVPLFFLVYFAARRAWVLAIASALVMGVVTSLLFETVLGIPLYGGLLF